jgi:preprotein translocase subunit Sec61beta
MKGKKTLYVAMIVAGVVILVLALAADYIGIGGATPQLGLLQIVGAIVGAVVAIAGLILTLRK